MSAAFDESHLIEHVRGVKVPRRSDMRRVLAKRCAWVMFLMDGRRKEGSDCAIFAEEIAVLLRLGEDLNGDATEDFVGRVQRYYRANIDRFGEHPHEEA